MSISDPRKSTATPGQKMKNELGNSKTQKKRRAWPDKRRKNQSEINRTTQPWKQSTGPKTPAGKTAASANALKHGEYTGEMLELRRLLRLQREYIKALTARHAPQNPLA
jgi:hypothetical protein